MLEQSAARIAEQLAPGALVLDVGGGARPFQRADWVLDMIAFAARGQLGYNAGGIAPRYDADTWVQRDICDREPWPFHDQQFDFAVCSHTLEDVRDPVWVCAELQRVAAAGYIEVPSLHEELTHGIQGPWVGWGHHRWLVLAGERSIEFLFKHHVVNRAGSHLPTGSVDELTPAQRTQTLWWEGSFEARERFMGTAEELDGFLENCATAANGTLRPAAASGPIHRFVEALLGCARPRAVSDDDGGDCGRLLEYARATAALP